MITFTARILLIRMNLRRARLAIGDHLLREPLLCLSEEPSDDPVVCSRVRGHLGECRAYGPGNQLIGRWV